jgi:hypothetical protein
VQDTQHLGQRWCQFKEIDAYSGLSVVLQRISGSFATKFSDLIAKRAGTETQARAAYFSALRA